MNQTIDYHAILPELILSATILLVLVVDVFLPPKRKSWSMSIGMFGAIGRPRRDAHADRRGRTTFGGAFVVDNFAILFKIFFLSVAILVLRHLVPVFPRRGLLSRGVLLPAPDLVPRLPA